MNIVICPRCRGIINLDTLDALDPKFIVGCGQKEGDFISCHDCGVGFGTKHCDEIRSDSGFTLTTAEDYAPEPPKSL